jgi:hypothetical protein
VLFAIPVAAQNTTPNVRPRASDLGLKVGILPTGPLDAIIDVAGVEVGQTTTIRSDNIRTGLTAVLPHSGNLYREWDGKSLSGFFSGDTNDGDGCGQVGESNQGRQPPEVHAGELAVLLSGLGAGPDAGGSSLVEMDASTR